MGKTIKFWTIEATSKDATIIDNCGTFWNYEEALNKFNELCKDGDSNISLIVDEKYDLHLNLFEHIDIKNKLLDKHWKK
jgi:hypothetical protein